MSARHLGPRSPEPLPIDDNAPLKVAMHVCRQCHHPFPYHYDSYYEAAHLTAIDFICRDCLGTYMLHPDQVGTRA